MPIHLYETCLKYEMPSFIPTYNPSSGEETGSEIGTTDTIYECEYPKQWDKKLEDHIVDTVDLVCIADNGRHYGGYNISDFLSWDFQDLLTWGRFGTLTPNIADIQAKEMQRKLAKIK